MDDKDLYAGLIRLHILHHAAEEPIFSLGMIEELARHGYRLSAGTLYPILHGLERKGYLRSSAERVRSRTRRVYRATSTGRKALAVAKQRVWELFGELFDRHGASIRDRIRATIRHAPPFSGPSFMNTAHGSCNNTLRRAERASRHLARIALLLVITGAGCRRLDCAGQHEAAYIPRARDVVLTMVPLLSKELQHTYPFLKQDFAPGGVLNGQEVYAFVPSTVTVVAGDTIRFRFINPEDDAHSFVLPPLAVALPGQSITRATYVAAHAGVYTFICSVPSHQPTMWGQLVVLAPGAVSSTF